MKEFTIGTKAVSQTVVSAENTAEAVGSGDLKVFATPMMIALMENAAAKCVGEFLEDGETSVGTYIGSTHTAATPIGMEVSAEAEILVVNGREIKLKVTAFDKKGVIGEAEHSRFVVFSEKFMQKTNAKLD